MTKDPSASRIRRILCESGAGSFSSKAKCLGAFERWTKCFAMGVRIDKTLMVVVFAHGVISDRELLAPFSPACFHYRMGRSVI